MFTKSAKYEVSVYRPGGEVKIQPYIVLILIEVLDITG